MTNTEIEIPNMKHKKENTNSKYENMKIQNTTIVDDHFCQVENKAECVRYQENQH